MTRPKDSTRAICAAVCIGPDTIAVAATLGDLGVPNSGVLGVNTFFLLRFLTIKVRANKLLRMVEVLGMRLAGDYRGEFLLLR
jgi:hypothetical protein